jgi:hypothetical protein
LVNARFEYLGWESRIKDFQNQLKYFDETPVTDEPVDMPKECEPSYMYKMGPNGLP